MRVNRVIPVHDLFWQGRDRHWSWDMCHHIRHYFASKS